MTGKFADIDTAVMQSTSFSSRPNSPEEIHRAQRVVCGAQATRGAKDAKIILEALGLLDPKRPKDA